MPAPIYLRSDTSLEHETGPHPEGPGRIPAIEHAMEEADWLGYERVAAPQVDLAVLEAVHPRSHIESIRDLSDRGGGAIDADTVASPGSYVAALHAAGGAVELVDALVAGRAPTGVCGLRPPGHHAEPAQAMGFCLFANVAVAARYALDQLGLSRVFVLDWDVHHGNGTNDIFYASNEVLFCSLHQAPLYPGTGRLNESGSGSGEGYTINLPVPPGSGHATWLPLIEHVAVPAARAFDPQLILVSAGFDAHRDDPLASCTLTAESFAEMARHVAALGRELGVPVGAALEGGYDLIGLATSVVATLDVLRDSGAEPSRSVAADDVTARAAAHYKQWWPVTA
jgi:acetoin utilization deacetylase AcuC-like enzyme